jgi:hypothetical protein
MLDHSASGKVKKSDVSWGDSRFVRSIMERLRAKTRTRLSSVITGVSILM